MRTQSAVRPRIASRTRETRSKYATRRRRQTSSAPATGTAAGVDNGGLFAAESANVLEIMKDPVSTPTDLAHTPTEFASDLLKPR